MTTHPRNRKRYATFDGGRRCDKSSPNLKNT